MAQHPRNHELVHGGAPELARPNEAPEWYNPAARIENSPPGQYDTQEQMRYTSGHNIYHPPPQPESFDFSTARRKELPELANANAGGESPPPRSPRTLERVKRNVLWLACIVLLAALAVVAGVLGSRLTSKSNNHAVSCTATVGAATTTEASTTVSSGLVDTF